MLQIAEPIVLVLHVVINFDVVGGGRRVHLLQRDAGLHLGPLIVKKELQFVLVTNCVLLYSKRKAKTGLIIIAPVTRL